MKTSLPFSLLLASTLLFVSCDRCHTPIYPPWEYHNTAPRYVDIKPEHRIPNRPPGLCCWVSLATLGYHHHIKELYRIDEEEKGTLAYASNVREALNKRKVKFKQQDDNPRWFGGCNDDIIKEAIKRNLGCVCGVREGALGASAHAIIVVDYNDKTVEYIDPNTCTVWVASRAWWDINWYGFAVFVEP